MKTFGTGKSYLVALLLNRIEHAGLPMPEQEVPFALEATGRKFRFDLCYTDPSIKLGIEADGATWTNHSRHTTGAGFQRDCVKMNLATILGYRVLRFTRTMIEDGTAVAQIRQALEGQDGLDGSHAGGRAGV